MNGTDLTRYHNEHPLNTRTFPAYGDHDNECPNRTCDAYLG